MEQPLSQSIAAQLGTKIELGYTSGRTCFRVFLMDKAKCSGRRAERMVDRMESLGTLSFHPDRSPIGGHWSVSPSVD